jgi:hypothetical protein
VKQTKRSYNGSRKQRTKYTIENGVIETKLTTSPFTNYVEDTIQNGVKYTSWHEPILLGTKVEDAIQNGVKHTEYGDWEDGDERFDDIIQNGIKETKSPGADGDLLSTFEWMKSNNTVNIPGLIDDVIENGVKHTEAGWAQYNSVDDVIERGIKRTEGGMLFDETKVDRIISEGVKLTNSSLQIDGSCVVEDVIQNGIKETHDDVYHHKGRVDDVIKNGVKEVKPAYKMIYNPMNFEPVITEEKRIPDVTDVIRDGIKEVQPLPAQDGNRDWGVYYNRQEDRTKPFTKYVNDVIESGIKETKLIDYSDNTEFIVNGVISRGIKE